jgi:AcrR family transcriptional regulator
MSKSGDLRARMIEAANALLEASPDNDISTRAVCEAVGVQQPALYRQFGDKQGLLRALVDDGFDMYVRRKADLEVTDDPVADLRAGWDDHMAFALDHPKLYRLMFSPVLPTAPAALGRIFDMLRAVLERCAANGVTRIPTDAAAQAILSANVGVALSVLSQPDRYTDPMLSHRVREAVMASCLAVDSPVTEHPTEIAKRSAMQLEAFLHAHAIATLEPEETALLLRWLQRIRIAT